MDDAQIVEVAEAIGNLIQDTGHVSLARLCEISEHLRFLHHIRKRGLAEFESDVEESRSFLLREISNNCSSKLESSCSTTTD